MSSHLTPFSAAEPKFEQRWDDSRASDAAISRLTVRHRQDKLFRLRIYHTLNSDVASARALRALGAPVSEQKCV